MRQVPSTTTYLILGRGRIATHFCRYFELLELPFQQWDRSQSLDLLADKAEFCSHVLFLLPDDVIESFHFEHEKLFDQMVRVHCSGALNSKEISSAHPLFTFSEQLYDLQTYEQMPFVLDAGQEISHLLPGLPNPSYHLNPDQKNLYHALCVMGGNFTVMLWEKVFDDFEVKLNLPRRVLSPYLGQICANLSKSQIGTSVLTGPLVRNDLGTIEKHLEALAGDPYEDVYRSFVAAYRK